MTRKAVRAPGGTGPARKAVVKTSAPPMSQAQALRKLARWQKRHAQLQEERDPLIKECWDAGLTVEVIASYVGMTPARVYQLKDDVYPRRPRRRV